MEKEKIIEEMARDICECYGNDGTCYIDEKPCDFYKDKSLFVELPCKVGDTVYISDFAGVTEAFVSNIEMFYNYLTEEIESVVDLRIIGNFSRHKNFEDFGKTVFLTKEEAERKLSEV
jgi:hypothetical protein